MQMGKCRRESVEGKMKKGKRRRENEEWKTWRGEQQVACTPPPGGYLDGNFLYALKNPHTKWVNPSSQHRQNETNFELINIAISSVKLVFQ